MKSFFIKIQNWEFWPLWLLYFPVFFIWVIYAFRLQSFFFFSTVNPKIEMGGFAGESKMGILNQVPKKYLPKTIYIDKTESFNSSFQKIYDKRIRFPCIVKPDVAERGLGIKLCYDKSSLKLYFKKIKTAFIIQEYIDYPIELAVLYYKMPNALKGTITSLCQKDFLSVKGNGKDTVKILMQNNKRSFLQIRRFENKQNPLLDLIPNLGEKIILEPIGNHNLGTTFLDKSKYIDNDLKEAFDILCNQIPELHYGRFDIKCNSIRDLKKLKNFSIMEINGVSSEPAHIYQPGYSFFNAQKELMRHWKILFQIAKKQIELGEKPMSFFKGFLHLKSYREKVKGF